MRILYARKSRVSSIYRGQRPTYSYKTKMQDATFYSVMTVDDTSTNQEINEENDEYPECGKQHCKHGPRQDAELESVDRLRIPSDDAVNNSIPQTKYYRLDQVVFAEPLETATITEKSSDSGIGTPEDVGEIVFLDNVVVKKSAGKRNKYFIDIKDGCLDCPVSTCSQSFAMKTLLKAHVRKVHCATTKYMCEQCGAGFTAAYLLKRHSAVHSGGKVQCAVCGKWLSQRTDLSVHMKTHGAARQHECAACGKRFLRLSSLRRHEAFVHRHGELVCLVCNARFSSRKLWSRHRATHAPQPCGICGATVPRHTTHKH